MAGTDGGNKDGEEKVGRGHVVDVGRKQLSLECSGSTGRVMGYRAEFPWQLLGV